MIQQGSSDADKTGYLDVEYRIIKRDGSVRWIHSRVFPVNDTDGNLFRMSGFAEDITDRKTELERIAEAGRLLSVGELASGVAHEINNPLAAISLYSESLMSQGLPNPVINDLKVISDQGKRAATIVRNLLQLAKKSSPEIRRGRCQRIHRTLPGAEESRLSREQHLCFNQCSLGPS